jgi:hypothetical protein
MHRCCAARAGLKTICVDKCLWEQDPWSQHGTAVVTHVAEVCLLLLFGSWWMALVTVTSQATCVANLHCPAWVRLTEAPTNKLLELSNEWATSSAHCELNEMYAELEIEKRKIWNIVIVEHLIIMYTNCLLVQTSSKYAPLMHIHTCVYIIL